MVQPIRGKDTLSKIEDFNLNGLSLELKSLEKTIASKNRVMVDVKRKHYQAFIPLLKSFVRKLKIQSTIE
jgi:hypothetical protein